MPNENQDQQNLIEATIEQLANTRMYKGMTAEEQSAVREQAEAEVEDCIKDVLLRALSTEQLEELNRRMDAGMSDEEEQEFFLNAGIDYRPLLVQALSQLVMPAESGM